MEGLFFLFFHRPLKTCLKLSATSSSLKTCYTSFQKLFIKSQSFAEPSLFPSSLGDVVWWWGVCVRVRVRVCVCVCVCIGEIAQKRKENPWRLRYAWKCSGGRGRNLRELSFAALKTNVLNTTTVKSWIPSSVPVQCVGGWLERNQSSTNSLVHWLHVLLSLSYFYASPRVDLHVVKMLRFISLT